MNKICTSLEQSKKLIELGIDRKSSDMYYWCGSDLRIGGYRAQDEELDIPAWSLTALLNILHYPSLHKTFSGWRCDFYNKEGTSCKLGESLDNPIDTSFEMVVWFLKNKKL